MVGRKNQVGKRAKNAFDTRESSDAVDSLTDMAEWFREDVAAMERALPRVVGRLPNLGAPAKASKTKRRRIGKFLAYSLPLLLTFGLGVFFESSQNALDDAGQLADGDTTESTNTSDDVVESNDWPDLETLTNDANATLAEYGFNAASESFPLQPVDNSFSSLESMAFDGRNNKQNVAVMSDETLNDSWSFPPSQEQTDDPDKSGFAGDVLNVSAPFENSANYNSFASNDESAAPVHQSTGGFSGGFSDYSFGVSSPTPYDENVEEPNPTQTAEIDRDRFLSNLVPQENKFNDGAEYNGYEDQIRQNNLVNGTNNIAFSSESDYNGQAGFNEDAQLQSSDRFALTTMPRAQESVQTSSRFQGFGSSWDAPTSNSGNSSGSPFPNDGLDGKYVAQNFEDQIVEAPAQTQKPVRSIRW